MSFEMMKSHTGALKRGFYDQVTEYSITIFLQHIIALGLTSGELTSRGHTSNRLNSSLYD
jgi:hypothetical protein